MKGYFSRSINSIDAGGTPKLNHRMDVVLPFNSPVGDNSTPMKYLPSGLLSDHDQSPNSGCSIANYHHYNRRSSSRSPLSAVENFERSPALVKVEDNVLVMDGVFVGSATPKICGKFRSPPISDSGSNSSGSGGGSPYKTELCLSWEDTGACRYGYKCQFAHGQEELRPIPFLIHNTNTPKLITSQPYFNPPSSRFSPANINVFGTYKCDSIIMRVSQSKKSSPLQLKYPSNTLLQSNRLPIQSKDVPSPINANKSIDWCPLDDGIVVTLCLSDELPSKDAVNSHICDILYGHNPKKRLPVFTDICTK